jgi:two-component system nitrogen regulation sensor histidine kinase GlnL
MVASPYPGLELLSTAVLLLDQNRHVRYANPAAENLFALSMKNLADFPIDLLLQGSDLFLGTLQNALISNASYNEHELTLTGPGQAQLNVSCTITPIDLDDCVVLLEFRQLEQRMRIAREERLREQHDLNRSLIRNLAHEIRNPLGGIRGAAQLLERELERKDLREYTGVIVKEADRLQTLMDRLLTPHRLPQLAAINIHEVLERVRSLMLAETQQRIAIRRDYDTSLPTLTADKEQLIQVVLNIVRNAAQALQGKGKIVLRTRVARQVTLAKKRYRHAIQVDIIDNGPGIPETIRDRIFSPLVSGRDGGSGLGLSLAQTYVSQHRGSIVFTSQPGRTCFTLMLPITTKNEG